MVVTLNNFYGHGHGNAHGSTPGTSNNSESSVMLLHKATSEFDTLLYPYLIEFALIGASFALIMAYHVGM